MDFNETAKPTLTVLIGLNNEREAKAMQAVLKLILGKRYSLRFSVKPSAKDICAAASLYEVDLILLFMNSMVPLHCADGEFPATLELVRVLRANTTSAVILAASYHPPGFLTRAEQAGIDGMIDLPYRLPLMKETLLAAVDFRTDHAAAIRRAERAQRERSKRQPRVVLLEHSASMRLLMGSAVWKCWERATVVACTDVAAATEEIERLPPDMFITGMSLGGGAIARLLERLAEQGAGYPIVVLGGGSPGWERKVRASAGKTLKVSCWPNSISMADLADGLEELL